MNLQFPSRAFFAGVFMVFFTLALPTFGQDKVYLPTEVSQPPKLKKQVKVRYPYEIRRQGGEIVLRYVVNEKGRVQEVTVMKASNPDMIPAACAAHEEAQYAPAMKDGKPVAVQVEVTERAGK